MTNPYQPGRLVVSSSRPLGALVSYLRARTGVHLGVSGAPSASPSEHVLRLPAGVSVTALAARVAKLPGIAYAVPDFQAFVARAWYPNDPGTAGHPHGWERLQWNFMPAAGVNAPQAWGNLISDHRPGAQGVVIAVLDSGVAYRNWGRFKRSPDFSTTRFVAPCDLVAGSLRGTRCTDRFALDRLGHGTFVAGEIAESTNNGFGLTGLAYGASIMPVRVLDASGAGTASTIAAGIRYAVAHGARVINLSVEFPPGTTSEQIPELVAAIAYAHAHGAVLVAAAGNDYGSSLDYPAADPNVISVGATTLDRCLAAYSDTGHGLDLVAPGGGGDANSPHNPRCHPARNLPDVYQMTFPNEVGTATSANVDAFAIQGGWFGTSMAAPAVSAAAAMVIASGVLGQHPTPDAVLARLEATARRLSPIVPDEAYGYGLINIGAATASGGPLAPVSTVTTTTATTTTTTTTPTTPITSTATETTALSSTEPVSPRPGP